MACKRWRGLLHEYQDGTLSSEERILLEEHLQGCGDCRAEWVLLQGVDRALRKEPLIAPPLGFTAKVMARIPVGGEAWEFNWRVLLWLGLYLVLAAGVFWGMYALGPRIGELWEAYALGPQIGDAYKDGVSDVMKWSIVFGENLEDWVYNAVTSSQYRLILLAVVALVLGLVLYEISGMSYDELIPRQKRIEWAVPVRSAKRIGAP